MPIGKKVGAKEKASEKEVEALVNKGMEKPEVARPKKKVVSKKKYTGVDLRIPPDLLSEVDGLVEKRKAINPTYPRHAWLLEAIYEKVQREK